MIGGSPLGSRPLASGPPGAASGTAYTLTCDAGSYTLTGNAATLTVARKLSLAAGSYTLTGNAASLKVARKLAAGLGAYTLTGQAATLTYAPASTYTLTCDAGSYALTGQSATLTVARKLIAAAGSYALNGHSATLTYTVLAGSTGAVMLYAYRAVSGVYEGTDTTTRDVPWLPHVRQPIGYVTVGGQRLPVEIDGQAWYRFLEHVAQTRLGGQAGPTITVVQQIASTAQTQAASVETAVQEVAAQAVTNAEALQAAVQVAQTNALTGSEQIPPVQMTAGYIVP